MRALLELEQMGYTFTLEDGKVRYAHHGERPDREKVRPLLAYLQSHRDEAVTFLVERDPQKSLVGGSGEGSQLSLANPIGGDVRSYDVESADPAWAGQRIRIENLPDFKVRHGLQTVRIEWPEGSSCLVGTMVQHDTRSCLQANPHRK